jgi:hypothetical protein
MQSINKQKWKRMQDLKCVTHICELNLYSNIFHHAYNNSHPKQANGSSSELLSPRNYSNFDEVGAKTQNIADKTLQIYMDAENRNKVKIA